ncbi:MAG: amidohydrolase family protein [Gemmatimonadota bacterium]|nr:amidohydrolase family protein [Gemmatimonadota bacterium]
MRRTLAAYKDTGLVCNLQIGPANYGVLLELAQSHPEIRFVANHLALPGLADGPDAQDETYGGLLQAAACPNLSIKASGFYAAAATSWDFRCPQALGFFSRLLKGLGADRLLWGSDWPPVGLHITYRQSLEIVRTFATELDEGDRAKVLGGNAARVYGI